MGRSCYRRWPTGCLAVATLALLAQPATLATRATADVLPRLSEILSPGGRVLRDRNGDGAVDFVDAQIVLGDKPAAADVAAAANIAARFGFEAAELNLPLPVEGGFLTVAVGTGGLGRAALAAEPTGLAGLLPGEGLVAVAGTPARPVLAVLGRDDGGTRAAAEYAAARLPQVWSPGGITLDAVEKDLAAVLAQPGACPQTGPAAVVVRHGGEALERLVVPVTCPSTAQALRLVSILKQPRPAAPTPVPGTLPPATTPTPPPRLDYAGIASIRFEVRVANAPTRVIDVPRTTPPPAAAPPSRRFGGAKDALDLSSLYEIDGLLGDSDSNLIPDRTDVLLVPDGSGTRPVVDLAARLALESAGVSLPLVVTPAAVGAPATAPTLVLIGVTHPLIEQLVQDKKFDRSTLQPGQGLVRVVRKAFGDKSALVVTGADEAGLQRAIRYLAERLPHVRPRGKDRPTIDEVEEQVRRFVSGRSPAGQAAVGLYKLDQIARALAGKDLARAAVHVAVDRPDPGLAAFVKQRLTASPGPLAAADLQVRVEGLDVRSAAPLTVNGRPASETFDIPGEVEDFWRILRTRVLPGLKKGAAVAIEARLSEPRELRRRLEREALAELRRAGAAPTSSVVVLSAYKQGYSWLDEVVKPAIQGSGVAAIRIRFAEAGPPPEWKQQAMFIPTRWLHEIFPIDEVLARDLTLDLKQITFEKTPIGSPTYEVIATRADGTDVYRARFEPRLVVRPYFDRFPDYEHVRVATGWFTATVAGLQAVTQRIPTDSERFWQVFQSRTLPSLYDAVMAQGRGKPRPEDAPHFGTLTVDVALSEPHERIGIDEELISPMEALHEDVYFGVLHFFDVLGRLGRGTPLDYPGRVIPIMRTAPAGTTGRAQITVTGFTVPRPLIAIDYTETSGATGRLALDIPAIAVDRPSALAALISASDEGIERLDVRVKVDADADQRDAWVERARAERVDQQMLSAAQVTATMEALGRLRAAGLYRDALAWDGLRELTVTAAWTHDPAPAAERTATLPANGVPPPLPDIMASLPAGVDPLAPGPPAVQWDTPYSPAAANAVLARLTPFREATIYKAGESYLGQEIWALDLTAPIQASHWSHAKATTLKPTVLYSGRQHANEVSSTSHLLKLAEKLVTDPARRKTLDKVNVVIHPITNPDGAALADELWNVNPDFMLHAAYLGSLGVDVTAAQWETDAIYPESKIRAQLWRTWLPDLFLNPHGYPTHEWVQLFSEYAAWVRSRATEARDWWGMRGWFMPGFAFVDDPKHPRHPAAAAEIKKRTTAAINGVAAVAALNRRAYDRYRRYGYAWNTEDFKLDFTDGVLIYSALKGSKPNPRGTDPMLRQPNITIWSGTTEAPDEPACGDWLKMVAAAGLAWDEAMLDYLAGGAHVVERKRDAFWGGVTLSLSRARPPKG